jgi:glucose-6-phosphate isomerase
LIKNNFFYDLNFDKKEIDELYNKIKDEYESQEVGYYHLIEQDLKDIKRYKKETSWVKRVVIVGIGGSSLGTKAIHQLLYMSKKRRKKISFLESVGPNAIKAVLSKVDFDETLFLIISKSGGTIETISNFKYILKKYRVNLDDEDDKKHFCIVTDKDSNLDKFAKKYSLKSFYIPKNVGGRFSVFSTVGLVPLAIMGYKINYFLEGAKLLRDRFFDKKYDNLLKKAIFIAKNHKKYPINVLFSYSSTFKAFNEWYVQLWGESLGKIDENGQRVGLTPVGLVGSIDQHSFLQLLTEGPLDKTVTFIKVNDFKNDIKIPDIKLDYLESCDYVNGYTFNELINAQCDATLESVVKNGINVDLIEIDDFSEKSVGYLIFYFELLTSLTAIMLNIDAYNQPGVEEGKKILRTKLK